MTRNTKHTAWNATQQCGYVKLTPLDALPMAAGDADWLRQKFKFPLAKRLVDFTTEAISVVSLQIT